MAYQLPEAIAGFSMRFSNGVFYVELESVKFVKCLFFYFGLVTDW